MNEDSNIENLVFLKMKNVPLLKYKSWDKTVKPIVVGANHKVAGIF